MELGPGDASAKGGLKNKKRHGKWKFYLGPDLQCSCIYKDGKAYDGEVPIYDKWNNLLSVKIYKDGKQIKTEPTDFVRGGH